MMYVVQTKTGCELSSGVLLKRLGFNIKITRKAYEYTPWRHMEIGKEALIFTGYIFLESDKSITEKDYYKVKNTDGVINFIGKGKPQAIRENEIPFINWLWNNGKPIEPSRVFVTV